MYAPTGVQGNGGPSIEPIQSWIARAIQQGYQRGVLKLGNGLLECVTASFATTSICFLSLFLINVRAEKDHFVEMSSCWMSAGCTTSF
jgi:hypothetical protein